VRAGKMRDTVTVEAISVGAPNAKGNRTEAWVAFATDIPAQIEPLSARELFAAQAAQSEVTTRITIRYLPGLTAAMRIKTADGVLYNIAGVVADNKSGREWITLPCTQGVNDG
jgi:SPP1 family predicted phage head-tail adaptor